MQRERIKNNLPTTQEVNKVVREGIVHTQTGLFNYCEIAKQRLEKLTRVTTVIEDKLLSTETLKQIEALPWQTQLPVYDALNKIIGDTTNFLHKMHTVMTDVTKTEYLKKVLGELTKQTEESEGKKFDVSKLNPDNVSNVMSLLEFEMKRRLKVVG